jgi:hypothetical protein
VYDSPSGGSSMRYLIPLTRLPVELSFAEYVGPPEKRIHMERHLEDHDEAILRRYGDK